MLTPDTVKHTVYGLLAAGFKGVTLYSDVMPANFERPAIYLELAQAERRNINCFVVEDTVRLTITYLVNLDEYGNSDENDLAVAGEKLQQLVRMGYIQVEDRAVGCTATLKKDVDRVRLELIIVYREDRADPETFPVIQDIWIKNKED